MIYKNDFSFLTDIIIRYLLIILFGLGNLYIFYFVFKPLTSYAVLFFVKIFSDVVLFSNGFIVNGVFFSLVLACIGGSAYYLLFILVLSTREIRIYQRIKLLLFLFFILYVFNVLRILLMVYIYGEFYFGLVHMVFWYLISTVFIFCEWIIGVKVFKIKSIPVYSDFKAIYSELKENRESIRKEDKKRKKVFKRKRR